MDPTAGKHWTARDINAPFRAIRAFSRSRNALELHGSTNSLSLGSSLYNMLSLNWLLRPAPSTPASTLASGSIDMLKAAVSSIPPATTPLVHDALKSLRDELHCPLNAPESTWQIRSLSSDDFKSVWDLPTRCSLIIK